MPDSPLGLLLRHLSGSSEGATLAESRDGRLLERFVTCREEAAFTALLRRHGPMVLSVCRRALADEQDREDVFQATFLLLARKADSIRKRDSVGSWLHVVAQRLAARRRAEEARRRHHEQRAPVRRSEDPAAQAAWQEMQTALDEAIAELPEKYRSALVLCYLEDHTHEEAAKRLGCRLTTLRSRVARGRERLRDALVRRGLALSGAAFLAALATSAAQTVLPPSLRIRTLTAALQFAKGGAVSTLVSSSTAALVEGGLQAMSAIKLKSFVMLVLVSGLTLGGAALLAHQFFSMKTPARSASKGEQAAAPTPKNKPQPAVDRFGDPLPPRAVARLGTIRLRHSGHIHAVAFSSDGKILAAIDQQHFNEVRLWDPATGKRVGTFRGPRDRVMNYLVPSADGKLLTIDEDRRGRAGIWDVVTGKNVCNLQLKRLGGIRFMQFAPDGRSLVLGTSHPTSKSIWFYDPTTGQGIRQLEGHAKEVSAAVFSKDGKFLASGCEDGTARLWDLPTDKVLHEFKHSDPVITVALSPDDKLLAVQMKKGIQLWDIAAKKEARFLPLEYASFRSLAFSPDGKALASRGTIWDVASGKVRCQCNNGFSLATAFSPDGKIVALGRWDGGVSLHDSATGEELPQSRTGANRRSMFNVRYSKDGKTLFALGNLEILLWDVATQRVRCRFKTKENPQSFELSPHGETLAVVERLGAISLWETATGRNLWRIPVEIDNSGSGRFPPLAFSSDGKMLAAAGFSRTIHLWRTDTGEQLKSFRGHGAAIVALYISRDGKTLISAGGGDWINFWDVETGKQRSRRAYPRVCGISPDGRWYATGQNPGHPGMRICDLETGKEMCRLPEANSDWCQFSPDGWSIAAAAGAMSAPDKEQRTVLLCDCLSGRVRARFTGHLDFTFGAAFSPNGRTLATASSDTTCLIWDLAGRAKKIFDKETSYSDKRLDALWNDLAGTDAIKAFRAVHALTASAKQTVPLLRQRLQPVAPADGKQMARWIADLDSDEFQVREQARASLEKLGELAGPALREKRGKTSSAELRRQLQQLLQKLDNAPLPSTTLQALRAIEVLEHIDTPDARKLLASLAEGAPQSRLTREAKAASQRVR